MKLLFLLLSLWMSSVLCAQTRIQRIQYENLPKELQLEYFKQAVSWSDSTGLNFLVTTHKPNEYGNLLEYVPPQYNSPGLRLRYRKSKKDLASHTHHFRVINDTPRLLWREYGMTKACKTKSPADWVINKFEFTDLDKDGRFEIWLTSKAVCPDDTTASGITILLYNKSKRYAMQGDQGSSFKINEWGDWSFRMMPQIFKDYALNLWRRTKYAD